MTLLLMLVCHQANAKVVNDVFIVDGCYYKVLDVSDPTRPTVSIVGTVEGFSKKTLEIPKSVKDNDEGITYYVTAVGNKSKTLKGAWSNTIETVTYADGASAQITTFESFAFNGCNLSTLAIPTGLTTIQKNFVPGENCTEITAIGNNHFASYDGALYSKDFETLYLIPCGRPGTDYAIKDGCKRIVNPMAIQGKNMVNLTLPASFEEINVTDAPGAFLGKWLGKLKKIIVAGGNHFTTDNKGILYTNEGKTLVYCPAGINFDKNTSYKLNDDVTEIAPFAFSGSKIPNLHLNNVTTLAHADNQNICSFFDCSELDSVTFSGSLSADQLAGAFSSCKIKKYILDGESEEIEVDNNGFIYNKTKTELKLVPNGVEEVTTFPAELTTIGKKAFAGSKINNVVIPSSVTLIDKGAFMNCDTLESVTFASGGEQLQIAEKAFMNAGYSKNPGTITFPARLKYLKEQAFDGSHFKIINVEDGSKLVGIMTSTFSGASDLENFNFLGSCTNFYGVQEKAFRNAENLKSFKFPSSSQTITIGAEAFYGCESLESITFEGTPNIETIQTAAFADCGIKSITIPQNVKTIQKEAFRNCNALTTITLGKNAKKYDPTNETGINPEAFVGCSKLEKIKVNANNNELTSVQGFLCNKENDQVGKTLLLFPPGAAREDFTLLPPSLEEIGDYAFLNVKGLQNICLPPNIKKIGIRAFGLSNNLNSIAFLGDNVINPTTENIAQGLNLSAWDDGTTGLVNMLDGNHITIYLTKTAYNNLNKTENASIKNWYTSRFKIGQTFKQENAVIGDGIADSGDEDEYLPISKNAVYLVKPGVEKETYVVPEYVTDPTDANSPEYKVALIGDNAFASTTGIKEVIINHQVNYIGKNAFGSDKIKKVIFNTAKPASFLACTYWGYNRLEGNAFVDGNAEFNVKNNTENDGQYIYVPAATYNLYKQSDHWADYCSQVDGHEYIKTEFLASENALQKGKAIPFSREFTIKLTNKLRAYVPKEFSGFGRTADDKLKAYYYMVPLEVKLSDGSIVNNGTLVPAGTAVMLVATDNIAAGEVTYQPSSRSGEAQNGKKGSKEYLLGALYSDQDKGTVSTSNAIGYDISNTGGLTQHTAGHLNINHNSAAFNATNIVSNAAAPANLHVPETEIGEAELIYVDPNDDKYTTTIHLSDTGLGLAANSTLDLTITWEGPINIPAENNGLVAYQSKYSIPHQGVKRAFPCNGNLKDLTFKGKIRSLEFKQYSKDIIDTLDVLPSSLRKLTCKKIGLKSLNVSNLTDLQGLDCSNNHLDKLDLSNENLHIQQMITNGNATLDDYDISGQTVEGGKILVEQNPADDNNYWIYLTYDKKEGYDKRAIVKAVNDWESNGTTEDYRVSTGLSSFGTSSEVLTKLAKLPVNVTAEQSHVQQISPISGMTSGWGAGTIYLGFPADIPEGIWASYARQIVEGGVTTQSITDPENNVYYSIPAEYGLETVAEAGWYVWREASGNLTQYKNPATFPNLFGGSLEVITPENIDQIAMYTENGKRLTRINRWNRKVGLYRVAVLGRSPYGGVGYGNYTGYSVNEETDEVSNPKSFPANRAWIQMSLAIQPDYTGQFNAKPFVYEATDNMIPVEKEGVNREIEELFYRGNSENPTSINGIEFETNTSIEGAEIYDLSGRKMQNGNLKKGIYIVNGRKTVISK